MPRMGTPDSSSPAGAGGAPGAYTEDGPPDRMIADGFLASISAAGIVDGTISEYTWHSRTRRAMSWAYCAPKSTTRTVSNPPGPDTPSPSTRVLPCVTAQSNCPAGNGPQAGGARANDGDERAERRQAVPLPGVARGRGRR